MSHWKVVPERPDTSPEKMPVWERSTKLLLELAVATYGGNLLARAIVDEWYSYTVDYERTWNRNVDASNPMSARDRPTLEVGQFARARPPTGLDCRTWNHSPSPKPSNSRALGLSSSRPTNG
jgi:hypothetical protein